MAADKCNTAMVYLCIMNRIWKLAPVTMVPFLSLLHSLSPLSAPARIFSWRLFLFAQISTVRPRGEVQKQGHWDSYQNHKAFFVLPLGVQPGPVDYKATPGCPLQPPTHHPRPELVNSPQLCKWPALFHYKIPVQSKTCTLVSLYIANLRIILFPVVPGEVEIWESLAVYSI